MNLKIHKLNNNCFVSNISVTYLLSEISRVYKKSISEIKKEYSSEKISEEYSEYIISSIGNSTFIDNIVLFTKEDFKVNDLDIKIDNFIIADGLNKLIIMHNLLIAKDFVLKRIDLDNINVFKDLYKGLFIVQTHLPGYYLDAVLSSLRSKFKGDIRKFDMEFLMEKVTLTIVTNSNENSMVDYMINKNIINKLLTSDELYRKTKFKMIPYND